MSDSIRRIGLAARAQVRARSLAQPGQAMTEFAIVAPLLLLIIYAMIIFALAIHTQIDFGNAVSTAMRQATVLGNGSILAPAAPNTGATSPNPNLEDVDALIGQALLQNLRSDDAHSVDSFDLQLQQSRIAPDALNNPDNTGTPQNIYKNTYCAIPVPSSASAACKAILAAALRPYGARTPTFDQNAWNFILASGISSDPCTYYFEAHQAQVYTYDSGSNMTVVTRTTYLDKGEQIILYQEVERIQRSWRGVIPAHQCRPPWSPIRGTLIHASANASIEGRLRQGVLRRESAHGKPDPGAPRRPCYLRPELGLHVREYKSVPHKSYVQLHPSH